MLGLNLPCVIIANTDLWLTQFTLTAVRLWFQLPAVCDTKMDISFVAE